MEKISVRKVQISKKVITMFADEASGELEGVRDTDALDYSSLRLLPLVIATESAMSITHRLSHLTSD